MRGRCARSGLIVDLTFDLGAVTLTSEKLVRTISQRVLSVGASKLVYRFLMRGWCAISALVVNLTFDLVTVTLIYIVSYTLTLIYIVIYIVSIRGRFEL